MTCCTRTRTRTKVLVKYLPNLYNSGKAAATARLQQPRRLGAEVYAEPAWGIKFDWVNGRHKRLEEKGSGVGKCDCRRLLLDTKELLPFLPTK